MLNYGEYLDTALKEQGSIRTAVALAGSAGGARMFWQKQQIIWCDLELREDWQKILPELDHAPAGLHYTMSDQTLAGDSNRLGVTFFIEQLESPPHLIILGGGHVSLPLSQIGKLLGFDVTVVDDRAEFASIARFTQADQVICADFSTSFLHIPPRQNNYYVLVTRGHSADAICAEHILKRPFQYLGMIGSRGKVALTREKLQSQGFTDDQLDRMHAPIGFKLGGEKPAEIAVSIAAELTQVRNQVRITEISATLSQQLASLKEPAVLVTIIQRAGSTPRGAGARMLVGRDGLMCETIGGGAIEHAAIERAQEMLLINEPFAIADYDLSHAESATLGMICGGAVQVIFENLSNE